MANLTEEPTRPPEDDARSPIHKVIGFAFAGVLVVASAVLVFLLAPALRHDSPAERLAAALKMQFPGSEPEVSGSGASGVAQITLKVPFDPTVEAKQAHDTFERVAAVAAAENLRSIRTLEVALTGVSLEGNATTASRTVDYQPRDKLKR